MTFTTLEKCQTVLIGALLAVSTYTWYNRPTQQVQVANIKAISDSNVADISHLTVLNTTTTEKTRKPNGEIISKKTKVISGNADRSIVAANHSDIGTSSKTLAPVELNTPRRYSIGVDFFPSTSANHPLKPHQISLGYRVIGSAWVTSSITLESKPEVSVGLRIDL